MQDLSSLLIIIGIVAILGIPTVLFILKKVIGFGVNVIFKVLLKIVLPIAVILSLIIVAAKVFGF